MKPLANRHTFAAIGTEWSIETDTMINDQVLAEIHSTIDAFDAVYSRFRPDSSVMKLAHEAPVSVKFPASIRELYSLYAHLAEVTDGAMNPLVGKSLEQLGYDSTYTLAENPGDTYIPPSLTNALQLAGTTITAEDPVLLDIGAIGKGYLADQVASILKKHHQEYVVDASGDIIVHRKQYETIGLEDPHDPQRIIGTVRLQHQSLCGSATNRRSWGNGLHHVIDARTGRPATTDIIATWAITDTDVMADALTTALFFVDAKTLQQAFGEFFYVTMYTNGSVSHNIDTVGELYS